jgi:leader peptidase (prepilin peptidase) / N-methyltransferase
MAPLALRLLIVFAGGACLGSFVNWAIYTFAWSPRPISPWSRWTAEGVSRLPLDRVPIMGWLGLRREVPIHGPRFWWRPLLLEIGMGAALAALYWWEVVQLGLIRGQVQGAGIAAPGSVALWEFASHTVLFCWMMAASFIDIDEKTIPDEITVTGTIIGLALATFAPLSLLPHVAERAGAPGVNGVPAVQVALLNGAPLVGMNGGGVWLEPVTAVAPREWPPDWGAARDWRSLVIGLACYWLWCFALAPRIWRGRRGPMFATRLIAARLRREFARPPLLVLWIGGTLAISTAWAIGEQWWAGLLTALIGLVGSGGIVWAVRLIGSAALGREAMGFGDVTLMMMVGMFLGWQACLIAFFIAPFAALAIGVLQFVSRRDDVIPYGPFLCLGAAAVVVDWARIWTWAAPFFEVGLLVPAVLVICLFLLGVMLAIWSMIKGFLFGASGE